MSFYACERYYLLFSKSGFTPALEAEAAMHSDVRLVGLDDM